MSEIEILHNRFCQFSEVFKGNTKATIRWLKSEFKSFLKFSGVETINQINRTVIEDWILKGKLKHNWSAKTVKTRLQTLILMKEICEYYPLCSLILSNFLR